MTLPKKRLAGITVLAVASIAATSAIGGGFVALILLVPIQWWAYRTSVLTLARAGWLLAIAISATELAWGGTYLWIGRSAPAIWIVPTIVALAAVCTATAFSRLEGGRVPSSRHA